jgi:hypothetical protein
MSNVLNEQKKQQVIALGKLGWALRRIEQATGVRRETASDYLKAAGIAVRPPRGWGHRSPKPANEVITDSADSKPANEAGVITGFIRPLSEKPPLLQLPRPNPSASVCEPSVLASVTPQPSQPRQSRPLPMQGRFVSSCPPEVLLKSVTPEGVCWEGNSGTLGADQKRQLSALCLPMRSSRCNWGGSCPGTGWRGGLGGFGRLRSTNMNKMSMDVLTISASISSGRCI